MALNSSENHLDIWTYPRCVYSVRCCDAKEIDQGTLNELSAPALRTSCGPICRTPRCCKLSSRRRRSRTRTYRTLIPRSYIPHTNIPHPETPSQMLCKLPTSQTSHGRTSNIRTCCKLISCKRRSCKQSFRTGNAAH